MPSPPPAPAARHPDGFSPASAGAAWRVAAAGGLSALLLLALLLPWWRNHSLLRDFCDYGLVIAGAGRMQLGEHPYVDFQTPIQTLQFFLAAFAERLWGARYLSLTYANAVFITASFGGMTLLLARRAGLVLALFLSAAVVAASFAQHTIVWYNAMGVGWLALVVWAAAEPAALTRRGAWRPVLICAALWAGGMTKLTFQVASLAFAIAFALRAGWLKQIRWRTAAALVAAYALAGVVAPVVTELAATGATFGQWIDNVILLAGRSRIAMLANIATPGFYLHTPHDYYRPMHFAFAGAWGAAVLAAVTFAVATRRCRLASGRVPALVSLLVLFAGGWVCSGVLLATNMDIAYVSAAVWLVIATGIALTDLAADGRIARPARILLGCGAATLLIPAWVDGWNGTRALWGHSPLVRSELVPTDDLPPEFAYLRGMRIPPEMQRTLEAFAKTHAALCADRVPPAAFYFVNATDWLVRAYPEARHPGLPLWLADGTTISAATEGRLAQRLDEGGDIRVVVSELAWDYWLPQCTRVLHDRYRVLPAGERFRVYRVRHDLWPPLDFAASLNWNLYPNQMEEHGGQLAVLPWGGSSHFLGGWESYWLQFRFGLYRLEGEMVAQLRPGAVPPQEAVMHVYACDGDKLSPIWEERIELTGQAPAVARKFSVSPGGRPVRLAVQLPDGATVNAGWYRLRTVQAAALSPTGPWPMDRRLAPQSLDAGQRAALLGPDAAVGALDGFGAAGFGLAHPAGGPACATTGPAEIWLRLDRAAGHVTGEYGFDARAPVSSGEPAQTRFCVIYYKSGRFEVLHWKELRPHPAGDREAHQFSIPVPEGVGWIGLVTMPLGSPPPAPNRVWWRNVRFE